MVCPITLGDHKNRDAQKKLSTHKVRGVSPEAGRSLWWERFVKEVGFERSERETELW